MTDLKRLMKKIGYQFVNLDLLEQALTHRSVSGKNNERLEFLGDAVISLIMAEELYQRFPKIEEGNLSRYRSALVKGETLAQVADEFSLGDYLKLGGGELKSGGFRRPSILADALEALIGAIYLDSDINQCRQLTLHWFAERLDQINSAEENKDPKTVLQEHLQAQKLPLPLYELTSVQGADHQQVFFIECRVEGLSTITKGQGNNRRKAEQMAADIFLHQLKSGKHEY